MAEKKGLLVKSGNRLMFESKSGEQILQFRKAWENNEEGCLDKLMQSFVELDEEVSTEVEDTIVDNTPVQQEEE